jgi:hypothetical protein
LTTFGFFAGRSQELARFIARKSQYFVTSASFGLCTREGARASNPNREKASPIWRVGVNVDVHIRRFFMGWAVAYEGLAHLSLGPLKSSQFVLWTLVPAFRLGVDLGPRIQSFRH